MGLVLLRKPMGRSIMHQIIRDVRFDSVSVQLSFYPPGGWRTIFREDFRGRSSIDTTSLWRSVMESELPLRPKNDNPIDRFMGERVVYLITGILWVLFAASGTRLKEGQVNPP